MLIPKTAVEELAASLKLPVPLVTLHWPLPDCGLFAESVAEVPQTVWSTPAFAMAMVWLVITTSSVVLAQTPLSNVHLKVLTPFAIPLTEVEADDALENEPLPFTTDH